MTFCTDIETEPRPAPGSLPAGLRVYAIGDLHGYPDALKEMESTIAADMRERPASRVRIIYLGDYIDRGPDSAATLDALIRIRQEDRDGRYHFILGNHETALLSFLGDPFTGLKWLQYGGIETAASYGIDMQDFLPVPAALEKLSRHLAEAVPPDHIDFLQGLEPYVTCGDYAFAHAGIRPGLPLKKQQLTDLTFIRSDFLTHEGPHEKIIVHGHTVTEDVDFRPNRIGLDTGLYCNGLLSCAAFEDQGMRIIRLRQN